MRNLALRLLVASFVAIVACGEPRPPSEPGASGDGDRSPNRYDGTWELVDGRGPQGNVSIVKGYRITLNIEGESAGGTAACNSYGGDVVIDGATFKMVDGGMTEMACRRDAMESESAYMSGLRAADAISRDGDILILTGNRTELRFEIVPPIPTADLIDTHWELQSLIYGTGPEGVVTSAAPAQLLLESDGSVSGSTGCRELYGDWIENGDEITFTTFGAEGKCPEDLREQDGHVVSVLGDGFAPTIEGNRLTVVSQGDLGLEYRASK